MKCYLINLDRAPERLARMQQILDKHGVEFERVAAVDARTQNYKLAPADIKTPGGQPALVAGDIACGASHRICLQKIASGEDRYGVIMEDDLQLADDISFFLKSDEWLPADADLVKLETFRQVTFLGSPVSRLANRRSIARLLQGHSGTGIYVVSKSAAQRLVQDFDNEEEYVDIFLFQMQLASLRIYQVNPAPAIQHKLGAFAPIAFLESGIHPDRRAAQIAKLKGWRRFSRETLRLWHQLSHVGLVLWFKATSGRHYGRVPYRP